MGHLGLTPQSVNQFGGYLVQGRREEDAAKMVEEARMIQNEGAFAIVLEAVPSNLAAEIADTVSIPVVGIGAGSHVDAQVLVWQDLAGFGPQRAPKFVKRYADLSTTLADAVKIWGNDVVSGDYPDEDHSYS